MALTELQRKRRADHVCSTDTPAFFGVHPQHNAGDVFYTKGPYRTRDRPAAYMKIGDWLENPLLGFLAEKRGVKIDRRGCFRVSKGRDNGILAANLDGPIVGKPEAGEAKYVGATYADDWGPEETDQVPDSVVFQCQHQMYVADLERVHVVAAIARYSLERRLYVVERNETIIDAIVDTAVCFWNDYVLPGIPPPDVIPSLATLKALVRVPNKVLTLDKKAGKKLAKLHEQAHAAQAFINKQVEHVDAAVIAALGDAEAGDYGDPDKWFTYMRQERKAYTVPAGSFPKLLHRRRKGNA